MVHQNGIDKLGQNMVSFNHRAARPFLKGDRDDDCFSLDLWKGRLTGGYLVDLPRLPDWQLTDFCTLIQSFGRATPMKRRKRTPNAPKVAIGEAFNKSDLDLVQALDEDSSHLRERVAMTIVIALIILYGVYVAHQWYAGHSLETTGQFLQTALGAFAGWCIGKGSPRGRASP